YGVHHSQVAQWIMRYDDGGPEALSGRRYQHAYSEALMLVVVQSYLAGGTSYPQLARKYGIPNHSIIYQWVNRYTSGKP
ncbi:helix-turn-helix domain-containing protein, partial [Lactiplantibacillus argentoratensis]